MTAYQIKELLRAKHAKDIFITECKNGPSYVGAGELLIMDAWVMKPSWASPLATAYEIKVSRSDFLRDDKWRGYLGFCNVFYFVVPGPEVIQANELPPEAGLYYVSKTGTRLFQKKRPIVREIDERDLFWILKYAAMSRLNLTKESLEDYFERMVKEKADKLILGGRISRKIATEYRRMQSRVQAVEYENEKLRRIKDWLEDRGFSRVPDATYASVPKELEAALAGMTPEVRKSLISIQRDVGNLLASMEKLGAS